MSIWKSCLNVGLTSWRNPLRKLESLTLFSANSIEQSVASKFAMIILSRSIRMRFWWTMSSISRNFLSVKIKLDYTSTWVRCLDKSCYRWLGHSARSCFSSGSPLSQKCSLQTSTLRCMWKKAHRKCISQETVPPNMRMPVTTFASS